MPRRLGITPVLILAVVLVLLAAGGAVLYYYPAKQSPATTPTPVPAAGTAAGLASSSWAGTYIYEEFAPPNQDYVFTLEIATGTAPYRGSLGVNGFQTLIEYYVTAIPRGNSLDIAFAGAAAGNATSFPELRPGDVLFTLAPANGRYEIAWGHLRPFLSGDLPNAAFTAATSSIDGTAWGIL